MALAECAATRIFTHQTNWCAFNNERAKCKCFCCCPVHILLRNILTSAQFKLLEQFWMRCKTFRIFGEVIENAIQDCTIHAGWRMRNNTNWFWRWWNFDWFWCRCARVVERTLQLALVIGQRLLGLFHSDVAALYQRLHIQLSNIATFRNCLVHEWLRVTRVVTFVVSMAAIANHVDHYVFVELLAIVKCQPRNTHARFWIVAVHVENWRLNCFGNIT